MIRRVPSKQRNMLVKRERDPRALTRLAWLLLCGLLLAGGFIYAGGRHFAALRLGYETEKLRNALNAAREDQRRLTLEREAAASPARLELAARRLGMQPMQPAQMDPLKQRSGGAIFASGGTKLVAEPAAQKLPSSKSKRSRAR
jgi:cell division protein FtsL